MAYRYEGPAWQEAADHSVSEAGVAQLQDQCTSMTAKLGQSGVRGHRIRFSPAAWEGTPGLPSSVLTAGSICRGKLLEMGELVRCGILPAADLFAASFAWGWGPAGYGPRRYRNIRAAAGTQLEPSLQSVLAVVSKERGSADLIGGYAQFYGGYDFRNRAAPGQEPWSRLRGLGPAFFTKFLYFSTPGALILDQHLARAVYDLSGLPHLVTGQGRALAWTPYRYAVYLHWMRQTAVSVGVDPELLELTLFQPPEDFGAAHGVAGGGTAGRCLAGAGER